MTTDRRTILKEMSAADLRAELIARLREEIRRHEMEIERINNQIRQLQPTETVVIRRAIRTTRGIARNEMPLREVIAKVLRENGEPMSINAILEAVKATGYQSNSTNFRGIVSIALANNQLFEKAGRGIYTVRPGAFLTNDDNDDNDDAAEESSEATHDHSDEVAGVGSGSTRD